MEVAVIGGGAAGCFCAVNLKKLSPDTIIRVYEGSTKTLAKVALTGGGRCNLTNSFEAIDNLSMAYPRGERLMKRGMMRFDHRDTWEWFEKEGVRLVLQDDNCVFPASQDAMQIVRTLQNLMRRSGVEVLTEHRVKSIVHDGRYHITFNDGTTAEADKLVVATGGSPKRSGMQFLEDLGLEIVEPVPSLFSFNLDDEVRKLMGTVVDATVSLPGTKFRACGPLLVTDWGFSGPAAMKLSSYAARWLAEKGYSADIIVNWLGESSEAEARKVLDGLIKEAGAKMVVSVGPRELPSRLWAHIAAKAGLRTDLRWAEIGSKGLNRLVNALVACPYRITGKGRFKDEFVTCGGVGLGNLNMNTLEAKEHKGLYFCGEALDIDAITGGFNLQAAWTTGFIAAESIAASATEIAG